MTGVTLRSPRAGLALLLVGAGALGIAVAPGGSAGAAARAETYPVPPDGVFTFHGRGFGHGHGMSQWGAYGAAAVGHLSAQAILRFYYPHTTLATKPVDRTIRVLLTAVNAAGRGFVEVTPAPGLTLTPADGELQRLPTATGKGTAITAWRLRPGGASVHLQRRAGGRWHTTGDVGGSASFTTPADKVAVVQPAGTVRYRGVVTGELQNGRIYAVNTVPIELYLRGVVPAEMPASWPAAALQAQAVAARTYATRGRAHPKTGWYDVFGDTRDQAYGGMPAEAGAASRAIKATAGEVVVGGKGHAIFAQYAAADGGWTVDGGKPYLPAQHDPYDGAVPNTAHAWTAAVPARALQSAYPALGTLRDVVITGRDGHGLWGGRVTGVTLEGSAGSVVLSGADLQLALGLRSAWFRPVPTPSAPRALRATVHGRTASVTWKPPKSVKGAAAVTGYRLEVTPDGHRQRLPATARSASLGKLPPGTHTVTLVARSDAGHGPAVSVVVQTGHQ